MAALLTRRAKSRWMRKARRPRFVIVPIDRRAPDLLDGMTDDELRQFVVDVRAIQKATRPQVSDARLEEARTAIRRWLNLAARTVKAALARYQRTTTKRWAIRKADPFTVSSSTWDQLQAELQSVMTDLYGSVHADAYDAASSELGMTFDPTTTQTLSQDIQDQIAQRVTGITDTTRNSIADAVNTATERGYSTDQLANGVPGDGFAGISDMVDGWANRADTIALTETGTAFNLSSLDAYDNSGLVDMVDVFDGPGCGWTEHDDPDLADGSQRTLDEADQYPEAHPNCQRAFGPIVAGAPPVGAPGAQVVEPPTIEPQPQSLNPFDSQARAIAAQAFGFAREDVGAVTDVLRGLEDSGAGKLEGLA